MHPPLSPMEPSWHKKCRWVGASTASVHLDQLLPVPFPGLHHLTRSTTALLKEARATRRAWSPTSRAFRALARRSPHPAASAATPGTDPAAPRRQCSARMPLHHVPAPPGHEPSGRTSHAKDRQQLHPGPRRRCPAVCGSSGGELYNHRRPEPRRAVEKALTALVTVSLTRIGGARKAPTPATSSG